MFASVFSQLPARLRRALALLKAFVFLEGTPPALLVRSLIADAFQLRPACAGDRRRGPGAGRAPRP
ncbi:MAG: hypothetical protein M3376_05320, partial [Actinomycetota bacterium]|nr:hypothetical protein [Actinomycetota bacterium]